MRRTGTPTAYLAFMRAAQSSSARAVSRRRSRCCRDAQRFAAAISLSRARSTSNGAGSCRRLSSMPSRLGPSRSEAVTALLRGRHGQAVVRWADAAWPELQGLGARPGGGHDVGLVPVGAVEQHGPHLPTGTDTLVATAVCEAAAARCGALVLPAISVGCSYGHGTVLPGTLSLSPELLAMVVRQYAEWAALSGLRRLLLVNAHFGNAAALGTATDHLRLFRPDLRIGSVDWWSADRDVLAEVTSDGDDIHANRAETSLVLAVAPELVHLDRLADSDDPDRTGDLVFRYTAPALSTNGVTGRPSEASAELGRTLLDRVAEAIAERVERGRFEEPPLGQAPVPHLHAPH